MSAFELDQPVDWHGRAARVVGLIEEPTEVIELAEDGRKVTVSQHILKPLKVLRDVDVEAIERRAQAACKSSGLSPAQDTLSLVGEVRRLHLALRGAERR